MIIPSLIDFMVKLLYHLNGDTMKRTPLYEQLKAYLKQIISENIDTKDYLLPSETLLSQMFNISRITSKKALNDLENEKLITRLKGKGSYISDDAIKYFNLLDSKVESSKSLFLNYIIISVLVPDVSSLYYIEILNSILTYVKDKKIIIQIENSNGELEREFLSARKLAYTSNGIIIFPLNNNNYAKEIIKQSLNKLAVVCIDNYVSKTNFPLITSNNYDSMYNATKHLIEIGKKNIAYISTNISDELALKERYKGYCDGIKNNGLSLNDDLIMIDLVHIDIFVNNALNKILDKNIDAIITANCGLGIEISKILLKNNRLDILDNLIVFDDEFGKLQEIMKFKPKYIKQNAQEIGRKAIDVILDQIKSNNSVLQQAVIKIPTINNY